MRVLRRALDRLVGYLRSFTPGELPAAAGPAGAGALLARRIEAMMAWALLFGVLSMYSGLLISYHSNLAAGAAIILITVAIFFIVFILQNIRNRRLVRPPQELEHG